MGDPYMDFLRYESEKEEALAKLPKCSECKEPIQGEKAFYIGGKWICESCMEEYHVYIDDYTE